MYECEMCSYLFDEPKMTSEPRGEHFGFPAFEEVLCCPRCRSIDIIEIPEDDFFVEQNPHGKRWESEI